MLAAHKCCTQALHSISGAAKEALAGALWQPLDQVTGLSSLGSFCRIILALFSMLQDSSDAIFHAVFPQTGVPVNTVGCADNLCCILDLFP